MLREPIDFSIESNATNLITPLYKLIVTLIKEQPQVTVYKLLLNLLET